MELRLNINKTIEQNAEVYFEKAKKHKKKIPGIKKTIELYKTKLADAESRFNDAQSAIKTKEVKLKKEWFEKFRWFISSDDFLVIGGRDATSNEIIVKKHIDKDELVFHTELPGSPFVVIKNPDKKAIPKSAIEEAATFCASFSKSWKSGRTSAEVFYVNPDQVSKNAPSGAGALAKGSFMINGKRNFMNVTMSVAICNFGRIMAGPISAVKKQCEDKDLKFIEIIQGEDKTSDVAKKIQRIIGGELDDIIRNLPPECTIKKQK